MSSVSRRSSSGPSASAPSKRPAAPPPQAKKRAALGELTNRANVGLGMSRTAPGAKAPTVKASASTSLRKKGSVTRIQEIGLQRKPVIPSPVIKPTAEGSGNNISLPENAEVLAPCSAVISPTHSGDSVSLDETMSTCDSMKSPDFEYIEDNGDSAMVSSLERRATNNLRIIEDDDIAGSTWKKDVPVSMEIMDDIIDVDSDLMDPQLCATLACDIYNHLRIAETTKRPSTDFMEKIQKDINASMRAILIDWLVEVAEEYRLVPDTLYLTVNYIDRYLSSNEMNRQRLQLLGVACMLIASKYEEICAPQVEEFCYITDNTYIKDEVLQMEAAVLKHLNFELTAPTAKCFLRRFVRAAQACDEVLSLQLEFLASYIAELSLLEYGLLNYSPSLIAASSIFLAKFICQPTKRPWCPTMVHYTLYKPSELCECVKALHQLLCNSPSSSLPAIREKYSQHKYKFAAKRYCPSSIPIEFFRDSSI